MQFHFIMFHVIGILLSKTLHFTTYDCTYALYFEIMCNYKVCATVLSYLIIGKDSGGIKTGYLTAG